MRTAAVRSVLVLVALVLALVLTGCSFRGSVETEGGASSRTSSPVSSSSPTTGSSAPTTTSGAVTTPAGSTGGPPAAVDRCHTGELSGSLVPGSPGAGQRYATIVLTNTGDAACTIHGYGGVGLVDAAGSALPTRQVRQSAPAPATITLQPGGTASSQLHWGAVPGPGDATSGDCQPTPAALRVIPPDETDALSVPWDQGPVCEAGTLDQTAYAG